MEVSVKPSKEELVNNVPPNEFVAATSEWKGVRIANSGMLGNIILPEFFDIPYADLVELLLEVFDPDTSVKVRAHIGINPYIEADGTSTNSEMKLYLTGVDEEGKSIYWENGESAIYDFVTPCPPTCQGGGGISE